MKVKWMVILIMVTFSLPSFALTPDSPLMAKFMKMRYHHFSSGSLSYMIDFHNVTAMVADTGSSCYIIDNSGCPNHILYLKNGQRINILPSGDTLNIWDNFDKFRQFLIKNPELLLIQ